MGRDKGRSYMGSFSIWHWFNWFVMLALIGIPLLLIFVLTKSYPGEVANTWKFRTVVLVIFAFIVPLWPVTLPLFLFLAYRSYKAGSLPEADSKHLAPVSPFPSSTDKAQEIAALHDLLNKGALTQEEFEQQKRKILNK